MNPLPEALELTANQRIAFRMGDDGVQALKMELVKSLVKSCRNRKFIEFHEQIGFLVQGEPRRIAWEGLQVLETQVEVAACGNLETIAKLFLNFISAQLNQYGNELELTLCVGSGNHMGDALRDGGFRHYQRRFQGIRTVVEAGKQVAVDVNHETVKIAQAEFRRKIKLGQISSKLPPGRCKNQRNGNRPFFVLELTRPAVSQRPNVCRIAVTFHKPNHSVKHRELSY